MESVRVTRIVAGPLSTNTYVLQSGEEAILIDPGAEARTILERIPTDATRIVAIISTHGHFDHITGTETLREKLHCPLLLGNGEAGIVEWSYETSERYLGTKLEKVEVSRTLSEDETVRFGGSELRVMELPGHTPGSIGLITGNLFFTGDTLFLGSIGRTDLGGSMDWMNHTLGRIKKMDPQLKILPGHGPESTLMEEMKSNPFLLHLMEED